MSFSLGGSKQKASQQSTENTTQTYTPNSQYLGLVNGGLGMAQNLSFNGTDQGDIDRFANPYVAQVGAATSAGINRSRDAQANQLSGHAAAAGAFGGSGWGLLQGENTRAYADAEASALAGINANGYQSALGAAQNETAGQNAFDLNAVQTYLQGLGLLGNWGTTTGMGTSSGSSKGSGMNFGVSGKF